MPLILGLIAELGIEAEAREVETVDIFTDEKMWNEAKRMVEVLRVDIPEAARDIIVHEGVQGCDVRFLIVILHDYICTCTCIDVCIGFILTIAEIQRESRTLLRDYHLHRSSTITLRLHNISLCNPTQESQLHNRSQYHRYRDHNRKQQIHCPHIPRADSSHPRRPRDRWLRSNAHPKPDRQDLPCSRAHDVAIMFYLQSLEVVVYLPQAWIRLHQSTT